MKVFLKLVGLSFCLLIILASAFEVALRIADSYTHKLYNPGFVMANSAEVTLDPDLIYRATPARSFNYHTDEFTENVQTNQLGWRDKPLNDKKPNTFRIIAVGDSFTFGQGLSTSEKTYPKRLETYLNQTASQSGVAYEVLNAGQSGYSPDQEFRLITQKLLPLQPNLVLWNLSDPGDLFNLTEDRNWPLPSLYDIKGNQLVPLDARLNWLYLSNFILSHTPSFIQKSYLANFLVTRASQVNGFNRKPNLPRQTFLEWGLKKMTLEAEAAQLFAQKNNFQLVVVILPYKEVLSGKDRSDHARAFTQFAKNLKEKGIVVVSITEEDARFKNLAVPTDNSQARVLGVQALNTDALYFKKDYHPNEIGADFFASIVADTLLSAKSNDAK